MKKDNILTKKAKQCLTSGNFIYDVSLMVLRGLEWYVRDVKAPGWAGSAEKAGGGRGRWWHVKSPFIYDVSLMVLRGVVWYARDVKPRGGRGRPKRPGVGGGGGGT